MKDIIITSKIIKREIVGWLACLCLAELINVWAIIKYASPWIEIVTQIGYVLVISLFLYVVAGVFRLLFRLFRRGFRWAKKNCTLFEVWFAKSD